MSPNSKPLYDLTNPQVLADPYPLFERMRQEDPVHWSEALQAWVLTRHDDVVRAFRDQRLSNQRTDLLVRYQLRNSDPALAKDFGRMMNQMMLMKDGADHHRLRILGNRGFTPSSLDRSWPMVQRVVDELLDQIREKTHFDLAVDLAQPLPALVIADLFEIPPGDRHLFQEWSDPAAKFFGGTLGDPETDARAANEAMVNLERYFLSLLEERRKNPGEDLMSLLLAGQAEGKLSAEEVCCQCILLLVAGHVTTTDQLSNAVYALLEHGDQVQRLLAQPSLIKSAVEECLRYDSAVPFVHRIAAADLEIRGKTIQKGQLVYLGTAAANRDPEVFVEPDRFDIARTGGAHIAFGIGPHVCLGAGLARRELEIGVMTLFRRMPGLRIDEERPARRRCESLLFRGFATLPVAFI